MTGNMATACTLALIGLIGAASATASHQAPGTTAVQYKVVDPLAPDLQYKVVAANPKLEVVRKAVAGVAPGCSISACSEVYDECGWCDKDGGYAVGYTKEEELLDDKHRTTMTLGVECKGLFVYDASKCPSTSKKQPTATGSGLHPPTPVIVPETDSMPKAAPGPSLLYVPVPAHDPSQVVGHHPTNKPYHHSPIHMPAHGPTNLVAMSN